MNQGVEILVVEDSPTQAMELEYLLLENGYRVTVATNGREALEKIRLRKPGLVISDIVMPEMNGYQLCHAIKQDERLQEIPVFLLTALSDPKDLVRGLQCKADNFIVKHYGKEFLLSRVENILTTWQLRKGSRPDTGDEIIFEGERYFIHSDRRQIIELFLSIYEDTVRKNLELVKVEGELKRLNEQLEEKVKERTAALNEEIHERKQAQEALAERARDLARSNSELEQFAYVASHDLQEPLRTVISYAELLAKRYRSHLDEKADKFIDYMVGGATRMQILINDLLTYSRVGTQGTPFEPVDCGKVIDRGISNLERAIVEAGAVITHDPMPNVSGDPSQLTQLFQNLIGNAIKYRGGEPLKIHVGAEKKEGEWVFSVQDNGIGIDPEYAERIFIIFQRLHNRAEYPGTGIGLAICKKIVERHGGKIWVCSKEGRGSNFMFTIPIQGG